jgi:hypothetical protein
VALPYASGIEGTVEVQSGQQQVAHISCLPPDNAEAIVRIDGGPDIHVPPGAEFERDYVERPHIKVIEFQGTVSYYVEFKYMGSST